MVSGAYGESRKGWDETQGWDGNMVRKNPSRGRGRGTVAPTLYTPTHGLQKKIV